MTIKSTKIYINYLRRQNDERIYKELPLFPITTDELVGFLESKRDQICIESMLPVLDNLGRLPEHGDKWIKSVVRHPRVLDILDTYKVSKNHPSDFVRRRFSDEKLRERTRRWKVRRQHDGRITAILNPIMEKEQTKKPTKPNITTQSSHISSKSSSLSPLSTRSVSPHGATKAAGFVVYDDGDSLRAQSTIEKLQQEKAKYKTIKLDTAHLSSCVSLVPQPILYNRNDII